ARKKADRKAWIAARHWAPPGVNWKALERANGERVRRGRNQLAAMAASGQAWTERGSRNQAGRVHVAAHGPDGLSLYVGSAKGGLWRGTLDGQDWVPIGDDLYGGAHWLAVLPNPNPGALPALLRGTDDGRVHLTLDDGATWVEPAGLPQGSGLRRLLRTAGPTPAAFAVARSGSNWGVYRSLDSGQSFTLVRALGTYAGDLWTSRTTPDLLYVVDDGQLLVSGDLGATWTPRGSLPAGGNRAELTGCEAGAPRLWAVQTDGGDQRLYRSDDAGSTWSQMATVSDYWGTLSASIVDPDLFAWGGVELHRTTNGGQSFSIVNPWSAYYADPLNKLHADLPGLDVVPDGLGGEIWYPCTDGGLYRSTDGLASVENLSLDGLRISQYYTTLTSSANPDHVVAGSQDQGWQRASQPAAAGTDLLAFDQEISGDYGHAVSSDGSHDWVFTVYPGFLLVQKGEFAPKLITEDFPGGETMDWMPFLAADPLRKTDVYLCATQLWRYDKIPGADDWNLAPVSDHDFEQQPGEHLTGVAFSPLDDQRVYAVTSRGSLWVSNDRAVTWTKSSSTGPAPHYFYGTAILASSTDADTAWVGGSGYGGPAVWRTTDGGVTWQPFGTGLPPTLVYSLGEAPDGSGRLVCGTEMSVYQRPGPGRALLVGRGPSFRERDALRDLRPWDLGLRPRRGAGVHGVRSRARRSQRPGAGQRRRHLHRPEPCVHDRQRRELRVRHDRRVDRSGVDPPARRNTPDRPEPD
ncbi:MAG: WD40/YVTN/BNR-like repeat-containing protein, partial [Planctomycetota bacterium]